ncbi:MAG: hypothetical protein GF329_05680 [Candidatus Lokiarchaeota archaeon]|nr:hypothetical protein [Candidatus Lokiarchaeota archaeon]
MSEDFNIKGPNSPLEEKKERQRVYFIRKTVDRHQAQTLIEQKKPKLTKAKKKTANEVIIKSLEPGYYAYIRVRGEYRITYLRKKHIKITTGKNVVAAKVFNEVIDLGAPERFIKGKKEGTKTLTIDFIEKVVHQNENELAFNPEGKEIDPENIVKFKLEDAPSDFLDTHKDQVAVPVVGPELAIEKLRLGLMNRPTDAQRILEEIFEVNLIQVVLSPVFNVVLEYEERETKVVVDAVSGDITKI